MDTASIAALRQPRAVGAVELIETHISWVLLTGDYAYKIKKPVNFGFLDFSTIEKRQFCCEEEVRLNQRLAPEIYLDVLPICGSDAAPIIGGDGPVIDYAVRMRQFDTEQGFDRLLQRGELTETHVDQAAMTLAQFHGQAAIAAEEDGHGTPERVFGPVQENFDQIRPNLERQVNDAAVLDTFGRLEAWSREAVDTLQPVIRQRLAGGFIRECHGDLHLRNIVLWQGRVLPFDCIEFNPELRWIDVISELAFLLMDLEDHGRGDFAARLLNTYLEYTGDYAGLAMLRYYQVYRALVRAKVVSLRLAQQADDERETPEELRDYLALAERYTRPLEPRLLLTHGLSGSGKTFLSQRLLEGVGVIRLRSDVERKRLFGLAPLENSDSAIDGGIYTEEANALTYQTLLGLAAELLTRGFTVIVDAASLKRSERDSFRQLAQQVDAPFAILHCAVDPETQRQRVSGRSESGTDASEAGLDVLALQQDFLEPLAQEEQAYSITVDTTGEPEVEDVLAFLR